ncbi:MAG: lipopolysaccharide biosynthesis protein [Actinomycetota bacterium]
MIRDQAPAGMEQGDLGAQAKRAAVWALLDKWVTRTVTTVVFIVLARLLTPYQLGVGALALVARNVLNVFIDQGFGRAIIQVPVLERRYLNTAFWTAIGTGTLLTLVTLGVAPFVARVVLGDASITPLLRVLAISLMFTALSSTQNALLQRELAFRELAIRRVVAQLVAGVAAVTVASLGGGAWSLVVQTLLQTGVGAVILWRYSAWRPGLEFDRASFRPLALFGANMVGIDLLNAVQQQADNFLVGRSLGAAALGIYAVAFRFYYVIVDVTMSSMSNVALSTFSRVQADLSVARRTYLTATRLTSVVAWPIFLGIAVVAPELISVLVGDTWRAAVPVLRALCPAGLILCLTYLDRSLTIGLGRPRLALAVAAAGVALRLVGYVVGVQFGVVGVAVGLSVSSILFWPARVLVVRRLTGLSIASYGRQLISAALSSVMMLLVLLGTRRLLLGHVGDLGLLAVEVLTGAAAYALSLAVIDRGSVRELVGLGRSVLSDSRRNDR